MAFPINNAATATVIASLPFTVTDTFGGVVFGETWYKYTNSGSNLTMIGMHMDYPSANPFIEVFDDAVGTPSVPDFCDGNEPIQIPIPAGETRWFKLTGAADGTIAITIDVEPAPTETPIAGDIIVPDVSSARHFPAVILRFGPDDVVAILDIANCDHSDQSPTGILCLAAFNSATANVGNLIFYSSSPLGNILNTVANPYSPNNIHIRSDYTNYFYFAYRDTGSGGILRIRRITYAGSLDATLWDTALANTLFAFAVNVGGTKAYYCANNGGAANVISAYDISGDAPLANFLAALADHIAFYIKVLADDSVLISYRNIATNEVQVRRYNAAAALQGTWAAPSSEGWIASTAQIIGDSAHFIVKTENQALTTSTFWKIRISDMTTVDSFTVDNFDDGEGHNDTDQFFGPSETSDILILGATVAPLSGIYKMVTDKRNDSLYTSYDPVETEDHAIPDPHAITGFLGDEE